MQARYLGYLGLCWTKFNQDNQDSQVGLFNHFSFFPRHVDFGARWNCSQTFSQSFIFNSETLVSPTITALQAELAAGPWSSAIKLELEAFLAGALIEAVGGELLIPCSIKNHCETIHRYCASRETSVSQQRERERERERKKKHGKGKINGKGK